MHRFAEDQPKNPSAPKQNGCWRTSRKRRGRSCRSMSPAHRVNLPLVERLRSVRPHVMTHGVEARNLRDVAARLCDDPERLQVVRLMPRRKCARCTVRFYFHRVLSPNLRQSDQGLIPRSGATARLNTNVPSYTSRAAAHAFLRVTASPASTMRRRPGYWAPMRNSAPGLVFPTAPGIGPKFNCACVTWRLTL
jgi:hypothetical protein